MMTTGWRGFLSLIGLLVLMGVQPDRGDNGAQPPAPDASTAPIASVEVKSLPDLTFATMDGKELKLDLFLPSSSSPAPVVVLIHGGGWGAGDRKGFDGAATSFAKHGYAAATVDYRLSKEAPFPAQIQDVKSAIRWLRVHASDYNLDSDHVVVLGHSAGGHLAALVGTSGDIPQFDTGDNLNVSSKVQAVVDMAGPVDLNLYFNPKNREPNFRIDLFGGTLGEKKDLVALASPLSHISPDTPPFLIISGLSDNAVGIVQPQLLYHALQKAGVPCMLMLVPGVGHGIDLQLPYGKGKLLDSVYYFLDSTIKNAGSPVPAPNQTAATP